MPLLKHSVSSKYVFVFGSNVLVIHGAGAALTAVRYFGAVQGIGEGLQGQSYAIPTKLTPSEPLTLEQLHLNIRTFMAMAQLLNTKTFILTAIGQGLAGIDSTTMRNMIEPLPGNVVYWPDIERMME